MIKIFSLVSFVCCLAHPLFAQVKLQRHMVLSGRVEITLPEYWTPGSNKGNETSFFSADGNDNLATSLTFQLEPDNVTDNDMSAFVDDNLQLAKRNKKNFRYLDDGIYLQDGKNIGYLKFSSKESGKKYFNYAFFLSVDDKPLCFIFSSPYRFRKKWEADVEGIANSLRVK